MKKMEILSGISSPADLKELDEDEIEQLRALGYAP